MDLTFQVPMQYCSYSIRPCFYHQSHPQLGFVFALAPSLHSFWSISPLISSSILGTYWPGEFLFQYPIILPFPTVHGVVKARILEWLAIPFSSGPHSVKVLHSICQQVWKTQQWPQTWKRSLFIAFSMIQWMLAIWSLVPLPFLKPAWTSRSSRFTYC